MFVVVAAPDSYKGSLTAPEVAEAIAAGIARAAPDALVLRRPMADGGEGTLDAIVAASGEAVVRDTIEVEGAAGARIAAGCAIVGNGTDATAVLECAQVVAITDPAGTASPVSARSTRGLGQQLVALLDRGLTRFMIGLGGSSTNDCGAGLLDALGLRFVDDGGRAIAPTPAGLARLARVDASALDARLARCEITIMSDVNNALAGAGGATAVFGPQKGVAPGDVDAIDRVVARCGALVERALGVDAALRPGAGAAGGLGFALMAIGGRMRSGAEVVADLVGLDAALDRADWAITGEGRSDAQTLLAKGPSIVADRARARGVPVSLLSGALDAQALAALNARFHGCFALPAGPATLADCIDGTASLVADRAEAMARLFIAARGKR